MCCRIEMVVGLLPLLGEGTHDAYIPRALPWTGRHMPLRGVNAHNNIMR